MTKPHWTHCQHPDCDARIGWWPRQDPWQCELHDHPPTEHPGQKEHQTRRQKEDQELRQAAEALHPKPPPTHRIHKPIYLGDPHTLYFSPRTKRHD